MFVCVWLVGQVHSTNRTFFLRADGCLAGKRRQPPRSSVSDTDLAAFGYFFFPSFFVVFVVVVSSLLRGDSRLGANKWVVPL